MADADYDKTSTRQNYENWLAVDKVIA